MEPFPSGKHTHQTFRFGSFVFSTLHGELRKSGILLKLQPQPARLLSLLLNRHGEIVHRSEIQDAVWGNEVNVDYELGVNRCIRQLRAVLMDSTESPRYIKTIPRQGYCFIAPVKVDQPEPGKIISPPPEEELPRREDELTERTQGEIPPPLIRQFRQKRLFIYGSLILTIFILAGSGLYNIAVPAAVPAVHSYQQLTGDAYHKVVKTGALLRPIVSDGARIYFSVFTGAATSQIAGVNQSGGETALLQTSIHSPIIFDFSPARSEFLLGGGANLESLPFWRKPFPTGPMLRLNEISGYSGSWSSGGTRLAYADRNTLFVASGTGSDSRTVTSFPDATHLVYWPRWSPDQQSIRFSVYDPGIKKTSLWEVSADGGSPKRILPEWKEKDICCGSWTMDGKYYIFTVSEKGRRDIWAIPSIRFPLYFFSPSVMPVQLTTGPLSFSSPIASTDNSKIFAIGESQSGELVQYHPDSGIFQPVAPGIAITQADFSKDGKQLALISSRDRSLWIYHPDTAERIQLTTSPLQAYMPRWSPDNSKILFHGNTPEKPSSIYIAGEGNALEKVISSSNYDYMDPDWSKDGERFVFSETSRKEHKSVLRIYDQRRSQSAVIPDSEGLRSPRWSPDGHHISAFSSDLRHLKVFNLKSGEWDEIASFRMGYANWSHNGKYIYVVRLEGSSGVFRINIRNHQIEQVIDMSNRSDYWTDDAWLGLTSLDQPLLIRDGSIQQIFSLGWVKQNSE